MTQENRTQRNIDISGPIGEKESKDATEKQFLERPAPRRSVTEARDKRVSRKWRSRV